MSKQETPADRAERILRELREATAEAAGLLKDLRAASRDARLQVEGYINTQVQADMTAWQQQMQADMDEFFLSFDRHALEYTARFTERAMTALERVTTIEALSERLAQKMAAIYKRGPDGRGVLDFGNELGPDFVITQG